MKQTMNQILCLVAFLGVGSIQVFAKPFAEGPYLGQAPPGSTAQVFAPGLICYTGQGQWESHGHFSADGNTFCFARRRYVYITENTDHGWTVPKRIKPYKTWSPCLSPDANSIYFTYSYDPSKRYSLHRCMRTSQGWSFPQEFGPPFIVSGLFGGFSVAANNSIYFNAGRDRFRVIVAVAPFVGNTWPRADYVLLNHIAQDPGIAPDESFMVFTAMNLPGGYGQRDLYLTLHLPDGTWSKPRNLGPRINSAYFEFGPRISPDKKYLFFTRANGWWENSSRDTSDIYWVELKEYLPESYR